MMKKRPAGEWSVVLGLLALVMMTGYFGTAGPRTRVPVIQAVALGLPGERLPGPLGRREDRSAASNIHLPLERAVLADHVPQRATLDGLLRLHGVAAGTAQQIVAAAQTAFRPRALKAGRPFRIVTTPDGTFQAFEYAIDRDHVLRVSDPPRGASAGEMTADIIEYPKEIAAAAIQGSIDAAHPSLVAAVARAGERIDLALEIAQVFGGQVDFNSDLQPGDRFEVLFEKELREGEAAGYGEILAASFTTGGRRLAAYRFARQGGQSGYYDEHGRSVRRFFLPSPLPFNPRVTSGFSWRRLHPVYGVARAHLGVDYAAPVGTPVLAVADGVVMSAGFSGASGRMVRLRHANGYQTYYLHLSSIAAGIRPGARVSQGETVGRVGASGVVTGPHLDYRLARQGTFVNPILEQRKLTGGEPIPEPSLPAFGSARDEMAARLTSLLNASDTTVDADAQPHPATLVDGRPDGGAVRVEPLQPRPAF